MEELDVHAIERYRVDFLVSILKAYGDDDPSILLPALLNECRVENLQKHLEKSLQLHLKHIMQDKILNESAQVILISKFGEEAASRCSVTAYKDNLVILELSTPPYSSITLSLDGLASNIKECVKIEDLFVTLVNNPSK